MQVLHVSAACKMLQKSKDLNKKGAPHLSTRGSLLFSLGGLLADSYLLKARFNTFLPCRPFRRHHRALRGLSLSPECQLPVIR